MSDDSIPTARAVEVTPNNRIVGLLIHLRRNGWLKRQGVKIAGFAAAAAAGWLAGHGGQEYAAEIAAGVGALVLFGWEFLWSWVEFKTSNVKIVEALNTPPPETKVEALAAVRTIAAKNPSPPVVPVILLAAICIAAPMACRSRTHAPTDAGTALIPFEEPASKPWKAEIDKAIHDRLASRYTP